MEDGEPEDEFDDSDNSWEEFDDSEKSEGEDDLLIPREKTKDELEQEQEGYRRYLEQEVGQDIGDLI